MSVQFVEAFYIDRSTSQLLIHSEGPIGTYTLYWTYDCDVNTQNKTLLLTSSNKELIFDFEYSTQKRTYFIIAFDNSKSLLFSYRILPIAGLYNFRDIGGYPTHDGKRIKWGVGYRSDYLYYLEDSSMEYMTNLGIHSIIDYRSAHEIKDSPNRFIHQKETVNFSPEADMAVMSGILQSGQVNNDRYDMVSYAKSQIEKGILSGDENMIQQQLGFASDPIAKHAFSQTIKYLADPKNHPSLQHCRGGKDRTGFGSMLLEGLLGVQPEILIYDYMLTNKARAEKNKLYYQRFLKLADNDERVAAYMFSIFDTKELYIKASLDFILNHYSSFQDYAQEELQISQEEIEALKSIYLEDS